MPTLTPEMIATIVDFLTNLVGQWQVARAAAAMRLWYRKVATENFRLMVEAEHDKLEKQWKALPAPGPLPHPEEPEA
jgi:hypothetical protein